MSYTSQELDNVLCARGFVQIYFQNIHYFIVSLFLYLRESVICKCEVEILDSIESINFFKYWLTRGISNMCETVPIKNSYYTYGLNSIGLPDLEFSFFCNGCKGKVEH